MQKYAKVTKEELEEMGLPAIDLLTEGERHVVEFKHAPVRKIFHNGEWWFSVVDVIAALTESQRARAFSGEVGTGSP